MTTPFVAHPRSRGEDCGVVAVRHRDGRASEVAHRALFELQHRGQEAAGLLVGDGAGAQRTLKGRGLVSESLPADEVSALTGPLALGHVRYSTVAASGPSSIQPLTITTRWGELGLAHNGNLPTANALRSELSAAGAAFQTALDTEVLMHLLARHTAPAFADALANVARTLPGAYSLVMMLNDAVYGFRDRFGLRPLCVGERRDGWVIASETCALEAVDARLVREVEPGELVELTAAGPRFTRLLEKNRPAPCAFELVYFARPNSTVFGRGVYSARQKMGELLAQNDVEPTDVVVPVPDSGVPAAIGYARARGVPLEKALLRSHYIGRTFILPGDDARAARVKMKLSVVREAVEGKHVTLVDDSLVRGHTARSIVALVKNAGAKSVSLRVASPPIAWSCHLGIDTPTREELIINKLKDPAAIADAVGARSVAYLTLAQLQEAVGGEDYCFGCMTGSYPT